MRVVLAACLLFSCGRVEPVGEGGQNPEPLVGGPSYEPAQGFVVHEWGTLTSVVASDGSLLPGLHHEEEDLPPFVVNRLAHASANPSQVEQLPIDQKMETPVTYFYSPVAMKVSAKVDFPDGMLTQWFPAVRQLSPPLYWYRGAGPLDPWLNGSLRGCWEYDQPVKGGSLDWGQLDVLAPGLKPELVGPLGKTTWGFARNVAANTLAIGDQREKFLFYRGLGAFKLPLTTRVEASRVEFTNPPTEQKIGAVFLMQVTATGGGFVELGSLGGGAQVAGNIPGASMRLPEFVAALKDRLARALVADGMFTDEAKAMVDTWERSYFLTPGVRALYLLPQSQTDKVIPLTIAPAPRVLRRSMVIRLELLTPTHEQTLSRWLAELAVSPTAETAAGKFYALGRFAQPHLARAVALAKDPAERAAGEALLAKIRQQTKWAPTAAE